MGDRYEPDPLDEFMRQAAQLIDIVEQKRSGDIVEHLCILTTQLSRVSEEAREICDLNSYYETVVAYAIEVIDGEVA